MPHLRLVSDELELDPPAPLPINSWRQAETASTTVRDPIADVERAMNRIQSGLDSLSAQLDESDPFPFPGRRGDDDDGPWAA